MGSASRERPARLAEKLTYIRRTLGLSQDGMLRRMGLTKRLTREDISKYERNLREPSLPVLLKYAQAAGVWVDVLIDDELDLPAKLPGTTKSEGIRRASASKNKRNRQSGSLCLPKWHNCPPFIWSMRLYDSDTISGIISAPLSTARSSCLYLSIAISIRLSVAMHIKC